MRRKVICTMCIVCLLFSISIPTFAAEQTGEVISCSEIHMGDGIIIFQEVSQIPLTRSSDKTYQIKNTITDDGVTVGIIAIRGTFRYDGTTVSVVSKSVTQTDTYEGWSYKQNSFTSSGGTITLDAKLTKLLVMNIPFTMTLSCDKDGNISYT